MEIGDYVRTAGGFIGEVISKKGSCTTYRIPNMQEDDVLEIIKSSPNIIDLIEVGDYVNGYLVETDDLLGEHIVIFESEERKYKRLYLNKIYIKSIVTKEQFESMEYKIERKVN